MQNDFSDKPLLLVFPHNGMAHYLRCLEIVKYFAPWYNIKFLYSERYQSFVSEAGFATFDAKSLNADRVQHCIKTFDFSWLNEQDLSAIYTDQVKVIKALKPDMVLGDMCPTLKMAAEKTGVYYLSLINGYMSRYYAHVRRMPRSYHLYTLINRLPQSLSTYLINIGERIYFREIHKPFGKIRNRAGLAAKHSYMEEVEGDLNLLCDLPELFPQKNLPANYLFIPPVFYSLKANCDEAIYVPDASKKTLLINMGSTGDWEKVSFLNNVEYKNYNIITAGDKEKVVHGSNVVAYSFINNSKLLKKVDLIVCHGGNGTCYQALSLGIPVLAITSHLEQDYNMDGLERCKSGLSLNDTSESKYRTIIEQMINKKNKDEFAWIKQKITKATNNFEAVALKILNKKPKTDKEVVNV